MLLLIDNFDSFTYNIAHAFSSLGKKVSVIRSHTLSIEDIAKLKPKYIVIGPGPKKPIDAGISIACIQAFAGKIPLLGICLGHQAINEAFGGITIRAKYPVHGKQSAIQHSEKGIFSGLKQDLKVTRYHSLVISPDHLPACLEKTAWTSDGEIMGIRHNTHPIEGVQFHPESILSEDGHVLLQNFLSS